ncbi:hypothetical protein [Streptomyces cucumeris]|uniref:hypothetical protein n=1 Tax=Streptomyces cucumeris TaxID=2962890 RepID=UPI0020C834FC|nr:hypothetical protein [Streptomyces sp. NEAU-Y11]MCP9209622.1 hypothetical protein [Streptomyces sp. NEAU-Y11]
MPYSDLERWWEVDFDVLAATAVAEATGRVHPTVVEALQSEDWLEQWADALYAASGELASSVERMAFLRDRRLKNTQKKSGQVVQRMGRVNGMVETHVREQGWKMLPAHHKNARSVCLAMLARHHHEEAQTLAAEEVARNGLEPQHPFYGFHYADRFDAMEDAVRRGLLQTPVTPEVEALLGKPPHALTAIVAKDVTSQGDRCVELRHPLLLRHWLQALEHLRDRHCELAGLEPVFSVGLPKLNMRDLDRMAHQEARQLINRRRFVRAVAQRHREQLMHAREVVRAVAVRREEIERPWREARGASRAGLVRRHPEQFRALMKAFEPFCVPGSTDIPRELLKQGGLVPHHLVPALKKALADGTWRRLLNE